MTVVGYVLLLTAAFACLAFITHREVEDQRNAGDGSGLDTRDGGTDISGRDLTVGCGDDFLFD